MQIETLFICIADEKNKINSKDRKTLALFLTEIKFKKEMKNRQNKQ